MKSKKAIIIPVLATFLTACGPTTELPKGYEAVNIADKNETAAFNTKFQAALKKTEEKSLEGFKMNSSIKFDEFSFNMNTVYDKPTEDDKNSKLVISVKDFNVESTSIQFSNVNNLKDYKSVNKIENLGFNMSFVKDDINFDVKIKDIDIYLYVTDGNIYLDLSDEDLKDGINNIFNAIIKADSMSVSEATTINAIKSGILTYCDKYTIPFSGDTDLADILDDLSSFSSAFDDLDFDDLMGDIEKLVEKYGDVLTLANYKDSDAIAIGFQSGKIFEKLKNEFAAEKKNQDDVFDISGNIKGAVIFDKEGLYSSFGLEGGMRMNYVEKTTRSKESVSLVLDDLAAENTIDYGKQKISFPNFKDYKNLI